MTKIYTISVGWHDGGFDELNRYTSLKSAKRAFENYKRGIPDVLRLASWDVDEGRFRNHAIIKTWENK